MSTRGSERAPEPQRSPRPLPEITVVDPACGGGHFLVRAFDLLVEMYAPRRTTRYPQRSPSRRWAERARTVWPRLRASTTRALARWLLPVPGVIPANCTHSGEFARESSGHLGGSLALRRWVAGSRLAPSRRPNPPARHAAPRSRGYFPAEGTALWGTATGDLPSLVLTADAVRRLRLLIETLEGRRRGRRANAQQSE